MTSRLERIFPFLLTLAASAGISACDETVAEQPSIEAVERHLASGQILEAQQVLDSMRSEGVPEPELAAHMGEVALARGDIATAQLWLNRGEFSDGTRVLGARMQGRLALARGDLPEAGRAYDRALSIDPENADLWVDIGRLRYLGGEQLQALEAAQKAVALNPESPQALLFRGQLARDAQGLGAAQQWFARAVALHPHNVDLRLELAGTLADAGQARAALDMLRGDGGIAARRPEGLYLQAVIAARAGNLSLSRDLVRRSGTLEDDHPAATLVAAIVDIEGGNYASAAQSLDRLARRQPDNSRVTDLLALALSRAGNDKELVHRFARQARSPAGSTYLRTLVGRSYEVLGDREAAASLIDLAARGQSRLAILPDEREARRASTSDGLSARNEIRAALANRQISVAVIKARELARTYPGAADALALLGDAELAAGNRDAAAQAYSRSALVRRPWSLAPRQASTIDERGAAKDFIEQIVRANPNNGEAATFLADAYAFEGKWRQAAMLLDHAMSLGQSRVPWVLAARSLAASQLGDTEDALAFALVAHELQPMNPAAVRALITALPEDEAAARSELSQKLASLSRQ